MGSRAVDVRCRGACLDQPQPLATVTAQKILELAKRAEFLYKSQNPVEQRRLLETVLSNCAFNRGTLCPTYSKPFDLLVRGNETGDWLTRLDSNAHPIERHRSTWNPRSRKWVKPPRPASCAGGGRDPTTDVAADVTPVLPCNSKRWSGRPDSNRRPPAPKASWV